MALRIDLSRAQMTLLQGVERVQKKLGRPLLTEEFSESLPRGNKKGCLNSLVSRGLLKEEGGMYEMTEAARTHLRRVRG